MEIEPDRILIASDVNKRDGVGIEVYRNNEMILEIFRDDSDKTRTVSAYKADIPLELIEEAIEIFKERIEWDFIKY
ncbi:MAG: hypothetical protein WBG42_00525 [Cryomorphaceae bacterium]